MHSTAGDAPYYPYNPDPSRREPYINQQTQRHIQVHPPSNPHSRHEHGNPGYTQHEPRPAPNGMISSSHTRDRPSKPSTSAQGPSGTRNGRPHDHSAGSTVSRLVAHLASHILPPIVYYNDGSHSQRRLRPPEFDRGFQWSNCTGRKRALCIGVEYTGTNSSLPGCINDAHSVRNFLIKYHGFSPQNILLMTDDADNPRFRPTRNNILNAMEWLVRDAHTHDSLFLHYSGHGAQIKDQNGDERDGLDELIFPSDFKRAGQILDDDMHAIMVEPLPPGCRLTALFDSCHSGSVLDLPFVYNPDGSIKHLAISPNAHRNRTRYSRADVISFSGCKDSGTSYGTTQEGVSVGAMSHAFVKSLKMNPDLTFEGLLRSVRRILRDDRQIPQLSSSHRIDTGRKFII